MYHNYISSHKFLVNVFGPGFTKQKPPNLSFRCVLNTFDSCILNIQTGSEITVEPVKVDV